jgi:hypothetical protein
MVEWGLKPEATFVLYDGKTWKTVTKLPGSSARFSRDGTVLTATEGDKVRLWSVPSLRVARAEGDGVSAGGFAHPLYDRCRAHVLAGSDSPEGRAQNRRIQITVEKQLAAAF